MRKYLISAVLVAAFAAPAAAQNVAANNGIWWSQPAEGSNFAFLNPLTTGYFRAGFFYSIHGNFRNGAGVTMHAPNNWGGGIGIGFRLMPVLRYELSFGGVLATTATINNVPIVRGQSAVLMNNLFIDIAPFFGNQLAGFNPFVFGGIGLAVNTTSYAPIAAQFLDHTATYFAWNVGLGVQYQVTQNFILELGYRLVSIGRFEASNGSRSSRAYGNQIMFNVVVPFAGLARAFGT